jgi:hypothetical protein
MKAMRKLIIVGTISAILALPLTMVNAAPPEEGPPGLERAKEVKERHEARLFKVTGVVGVGVGLRGDSRPAVVIFTEKPGVRGLPASLERVPVMVRVSGKFIALPKGGNGKGKPPKQPDEPAPDERWPRPVPIGVSTGHPAITAGTIGARVKDAAGNVYALSNNHVYANSNDATIGDNVTQPGRVDGGTIPADVIGTLSAFVPIDFDGGNNFVDAAIAITSEDVLKTSTPSDGYGTPRSTTASPTIAKKVKKYGRTTGLTKGQIMGILTSVDVDYGEPGSPKLARFVNQLVVYPGSFSAPGDSGSLIVTDARGRNDRQPVGLLFAGSDFFTLANPIDYVRAMLGVEIDAAE